MEESYKEHGTFSWVELATSDIEGAKKFYSELFGWETEEVAMTGVDYWIIKTRGEPVGGIMPLAAQGIASRPFWGNYVTVRDVDAAVRKARELGGEVVISPTDIPDVGRFATLRDPQGAMISIVTYVQK